MKYLIEYVGGLWRATRHAFERRDLMHTIILSLVALAVAYLSALGIAVATPHGEVWQWTTGLWIVFQFVFIAPFLLWVEQTKKVEKYEADAIPKLTVSEPIETVEPKGTIGKAFRTWRLKITNISSVTVKGCYAKKKSFINKDGHQSDIIGIRFKWGGDHPARLFDFSYTQSFDIPPGAHEYVDIACMDETADKSPTVYMLYAISGGGCASIRNAISTVVFPHKLILEVCAENLNVPIEAIYKLYINDTGLFRMDLVNS